MSIIIISRGSFSKGKEVAEQVAHRLNYATLSREVLIEASKEFNIPQIKLDHAINDAPSFLERFTFGKQRYIAYIECALLEQLQKDNVVYHGLAGHFFVRNIPHVVKVRILADLEDRIQTRKTQEEASRSKLIDNLEKDDHARRQWGLKLYGMDPWDASLYDLVIHTQKLTIENAVDLICHTVEYDQFKTTPESQRAINDLTLAAKVKTTIVEKYPNCEVTAKSGAVDIAVHAHASRMDMEIEEVVKSEAERIPGVQSVTTSFVASSFFNK